MQALKVTVVPVTPFAQNCSVVACTATDLAAIVDPGGDLPRIMEAIAQLGVTPEKILLTHGHIDHAGAAADLADALSVPIEGPHEADAFLLAGLAEQGKRFGITEARNVTPTRWFTEGDSVKVGKLTFNVLHVPGHTPGHLVFVAEPNDSRWSATRCSRAPSAAPISPMAVTISSSRGSRPSCCRSAMT
jgi:hydroxyacylglutathione hydrolase